MRADAHSEHAFLELPMHSRRLVVVLCAPALLAACGDVRAAGAGAAAPVPQWRAEPGPSLAIGNAEGAADYQFEEISSVRRRLDGTFAVADRGARQVRFYDAAGRYLLTAGRKGRGPGEFEGLSRLFLLPGDSVAAWDPNQQRLTVLAPGGAVARVESLELPGYGAAVDAVFADGSLVAHPGIDPFQMHASAEGQRRLPVVHMVRPAGQAEWRPLDGMPGLEEVVVRHGRGSGTSAVLFGRRHVAAAGKARWYTGDTDRFAITVRAADGTPVQVLQRDHTPTRVSAAHLARAHEDLQRSRREDAAALPPGLAGQAGDEPVPPHRETMPAFDAVVEDSDGKVWVRHYHFPSDAPQRWSVFSPTGQLVAEAETPAGLHVQQIGPEWIMGVAKDDMGVSYVHVHALARS
jgi:hypothetical protein